MDVELSVIGEKTYHFTITNETYGELLNEIGLSPQEVAVIVNGRPVPEDQTVSEDEIKVIRMIKGG